MTDELIEQIKRDRDAGTPGPWFMDPDEGPCHPRVESGEKLVAECGNCESWLDAKDEWEANARRIALVPDLEAMVLEQADEITRLRADLAAAREQVAGAWVAAQKALITKKFSEDDLDGFEPLWNSAMERAAAIVAALTPSDATAALEAIKAQVEAETRKKVIDEAAWSVAVMVELMLAIGEKWPTTTEAKAKMILDRIGTSRADTSNIGSLADSLRHERKEAR